MLLAVWIEPINLLLHLSYFFFLFEWMNILNIYIYMKSYVGAILRIQPYKNNIGCVRENYSIVETIIRFFRTIVFSIIDIRKHLYILNTLWIFYNVHDLLIICLYLPGYIDWYETKISEIILSNKVSKKSLYLGLTIIVYPLVHINGVYKLALEKNVCLIYITNHNL